MILGETIFCLKSTALSVAMFLSGITGTAEAHLTVRKNIKRTSSIIGQVLVVMVQGVKGIRVVILAVALVYR